MSLHIKSKYIPVSLLLLTGAYAPKSWSQNVQRGTDTVIRTQEFNVYQVYVPEVQKKTKERIIPDVPKFDTINPVYQYEVPEQKLTYTYQAVPIRPLALGLDKQQHNFENYIKAGFGNYSSFLLDAGISALQTEKFQSVLHARHLSQKGGLTNRQSSLSEFSGTGYYQLEHHDLEAGIQFTRRGSSYYGLNQPVYPYPELDSVRQVYWGIKGQVAIENSNNSRFVYKPRLGGSYYADRRNASETGMDISIPLAYQIDSTLKLGLDLNGNFYSYTVNNRSVGNHLIAARPYADISILKSDLHIGIRPSLGIDNRFYLLPDITLRVPLIENALTLNGGFKGEVIQNTFEQLSSKNPFIYNNYLVQQSRQLKVFGGFDSKLGKHMSLGGSIAWNQWNNLPVFINDYSRTADGRYFSIIYEGKVQGLTFDGYFKYQVNESFGVTGAGSWTSFTYKERMNKIYHEPQLKLSGEVFARPVKQLYLSAKLEYWDRIFYLTETGTTENLLPITDLSLQGEYQIIPRLSLFLQLNNILNRQYERFNLYNVYGFNIIGGLRFKF